MNHAEALRFACNAVVLARSHRAAVRLPGTHATLQARGYTVHSVDLSEFLKAGGAAKCLTLLLR